LIQDSIQDLKALDGAGFQWFPQERKKGLKALISITYRIQWNSAALCLERETRLASGVLPIDIHGISFFDEPRKVLILDL
ncbi:hypothetical protein ACTXNP_27835, partial [Pseudomonas helleri]|uniref:hypothetical protein n=1 Tax=Pseudomonas helleri TaxID=1608996 RepID=UPI003FD0F636